MFSRLSDWWNGKSAKTVTSDTSASTASTDSTDSNDSTTSTSVITDALSPSPLDELLKSLQQKMGECEVNKALWMDLQTKLCQKFPEKLEVQDANIVVDNRGLFRIYWDKIQAFALELVTPENEEIKKIFNEAEKHVDSLQKKLKTEKEEPLKQCETAIEIYDDLIDLLKNISAHIQDAKEHKEGALRVFKYLLDLTAKLSMGIILPEIDFNKIDNTIERDEDQELREGELISKMEAWVDGTLLQTEVEKPSFQVNFSTNR